MSEKIQPVVILDLPFAISEKYPDGRSILPNSRPGYIAAALAADGIRSCFVSQSSGGYDKNGFTEYWTVQDLNKPHEAVEHVLPPSQRLVGHAYRRRDGIDPMLEKLMPGFNSTAFCDAVQDRKAMSERLGSWGVAVPYTAESVSTNDIGRLQNELADENFVVIRPGKVGIDGLEVVLRRNELIKRVSELKLGSVSMQELIRPTPFGQIAETLQSELPLKEGLHSVRLYTIGTDTYAAELQQHAPEGGARAEASELFYPDEIRERTPELYAAHTAAVRGMDAAFPSSSSYMITWRHGRNATGTEGWYAIESNARPYTPDLEKGNAKQQHIAQQTVTRGDVDPLRSLALATYNQRQESIITLR